MALLKKFRSTRGIGKASVEEIASTAGVNAALAEQVKASCIAVGG
jgi:excinuclease UvrABC nuclease subunit